MTPSWTKEIARSPDDGTGAAPLETQGTPAPANQAATASDYSWVPAEYVKDGAPDFGAFSQHYTTLAAEAAARADQPQPPEAYTYGLPEGLSFEGLPEGVTIQIMADDPATAPIFEKFGGMARELGLPQEAVTGMMGLMAEYEAARVAASVSSRKADIATLGQTEPVRVARIAAVKDRITKAIPDQKQAQALMDAVQTADGVKALETLFSRGLGPTAPATQPPGANLAGLHGRQLLSAALQSKR